MSSIPIQPVDSAAEHGTLQLSLFFRVKVLDIATGQPVTDAYAIQPAVDQGTMDRLAIHPFRVMKKTEIQIGWDEGNKRYRFKQNFMTLRTCLDMSWDYHTPTRFGRVWKCVPEFFHGDENMLPSVRDGNGDVYEPVHGDDKVFVCVEKGGEVLAERSLITNLDGILEIPISIGDALAGKEVVIEFRDYRCAVADGPFSPGAGGETIRVSLGSSPKDNDWMMKAGAATRNFRDTVTHKISPYTSFMDGSDPTKIGLTLWVIRKAKEYDGNAKTSSRSRGRKKPRGIMIHFNSGFFINEQRGTKRGTNPLEPIWRKLSESFDHDENDYMLQSSETALQILKAYFGAGTTLGYHYHIERDGQIVCVIDEERWTAHAGESREKGTVEAEENAAPGTSPAKIYTVYLDSEGLAGPADMLNNEYIGIDLIGYHEKEEYHFTERQVWYLDRLIENIMARRSEVKWYYIQGHDEVRKEWNEKYPALKIAPKPDPGSALPGGMSRLRGRHHGPFL